MEREQRLDRPDPKFNNALEADAHNWDARELDRPDREKIVDILDGADVAGLDRWVWEGIAEELLALFPSEEEIREQERERAWAMLWDAVDETDDNFPIDWVDDNCGSKAYITHHKLCLLRQALQQGKGE